MIKSRVITTTILLLLMALVASEKPCQGCSLAMHDWRLRFYQKVILPSPVMPIAELDVLLSKEFHNLAKVFWTTNQQWYNSVQVAIFPMFYGLWARTPATAAPLKDSGSDDQSLKLPRSIQAKWHLLEDGASVGEITSQRAKMKDFPLILGSDKSILKIALFSDKNSADICYQLIVVQEGRIRAVRAEPGMPWAQEINAKAYISIIFFHLPIPGKILNIALFPINSSSIDLYEDPEITAELLNNNLLLPRPVSDFAPESREIPEMPE